MSSWNTPLSPSYRRHRQDEPWYDTMQICENGHVVTDLAQSHPEYRKQFCQKCGAPTMTTCRKCNTNIPGHLHNTGVVSIRTTPPPACCSGCGEPFPWTAKKQPNEGKLAPVPVEDGEKQPVETSKKMVMAATASQVFVVHGHTEDMKEAAARTLSTLGLDPIILHEQPDQGRTIIEKFEAHSHVGFAVILLSGDDMAYQRGVEYKKAKPRPRARQNVILELGYFLGKLGRNKVLTLYKQADDFELPSDIQGMIYTPYDMAGSWRFTLARELTAAGYKVDANKLL